MAAQFILGTVLGFAAGAVLTRPKKKKKPTRDALIAAEDAHLASIFGTPGASPALELRTFLQTNKGTLGEPFVVRADAAIMMLAAIEDGTRPVEDLPAVLTELRQLGFPKFADTVNAYFGNGGA